MSHEKRMHMIDEQGAGGFALEEGHKLDSNAVEKIQETVDVSEIVAKYDKESVYRSFKGWLDIFIKILCIAFSAFHLYTAATTPFAPQIQRAVHLGFVLTLIYLLYPARATGNMNKLAWYDAILAIAGAVVCGYIVWQYDIIVLDAGPATELDFIMGCASILLVLEATRRIVGIPITLVAVVFLLYAKFGNLIPGMLGHPGFSVQRIVSHMYLTTEGLFGMPLGVSASFVFLFILFGAFLHSTGLGKFFIDLALAAAGRYVGGPAKVAVISSALEGMYSGSSVANTVGSGSITIPTMKKVGYKPEFAAAVEAAASTGGQIMPPIMGAAAFLMAEYMNIPYAKVAVKAILPAVLYFTGIFIAVHLEAKKLGLKGMPKSEMVSWGELAKRAYLIIPLALLIFLVSSGSRTMQFSAAVSILAAIVVGFLNKEERLTFGKIVEALEAGAKGAITVAVACAMAGMIAGCITVTGLASILINAIVQMAGDATMIGLLLTMICCIILGMGVPTTANYCIMASTCAPILVQMGFPLVAAHFFVFYFGIVADITPPVALAAYAGAAIAKANPMKTGINATKLAIAAFIVPYIFAYSPAMLFDNVSSAFEVVQIVVSALIGLFGVAAALNGFVYKKIPMLFRLAMAAGGLCMMIPGTASDVVGLVVVGGIVLIQRMSARRLAA